MDLIYKNTPQRDLMLTFLPPAKKKWEKAPVYFIIPGGGWHTSIRQSMIDFSAISVNALREEGFAVVAIDYRVVKEGVVWDEIVGDCFDAVRYISHFADTLEIDKKKFVMSGHSAGGHLALMLSYVDEKAFPGELSDNFEVKAVLAMSAPTILFDNSTHNLHSSVEDFLGGLDKEIMRKASPITYVSQDVPATLLIAGTSDNLVFSSSSEKLYEKLLEYGVDTELILSVGGGHCYEKMDETIVPTVSMEEIQRKMILFARTRV